MYFFGRGRNGEIAFTWCRTSTPAANEDVRRSQRANTTEPH